LDRKASGPRFDCQSLRKLCYSRDGNAIFFILFVSWHGKLALGVSSFAVQEAKFVVMRKTCVCTAAFWTETTVGSAK
jgi:hypothetical protein